MQVSFHCPDCFEVHQLPLAAEYVLSLRCEACELQLEWRNARIELQYARAA